MRRDLARLLRGLVDRLDPAVVRRVEVRPVFAAAIPDKTPFELDEETELERRDTALELLDPDTLGYCLVRLVRDGENGRVDLNWCVPTALQPAVGHTLIDIARHVGVEA